MFTRTITHSLPSINAEKLLTELATDTPPLPVFDHFYVQSSTELVFYFFSDPSAEEEGLLIAAVFAHVDNNEKYSVDHNAYYLGGYYVSKGTAADLPTSQKITQVVPSDSNNLLTSDEKAALVGTDGLPSSANKFVTNSDPRLSGGGSSSEIRYTYVTSNFVSNSTTYVSLPNSTISVVSGTYLFDISGIAKHSANGNTITVILSFNGVDDVSSEHLFYPSDKETTFNVRYIKDITTPSPQDVLVRVKANNGTMTFRKRLFTAIAVNVV